MVSYKGDFSFQWQSKYVYKYTDKVVPNKHETTEKFFFFCHVKQVSTTKLNCKPFQWKSIIIISNNPKNKLKIKTHLQCDQNNIKKFKIINFNNILYKKCNFFLKTSFNISDLISYIYIVKIINFSFLQSDF